MGLANIYKDRKEYEKSFSWHQKARDIIAEESFDCSPGLLDDSEREIESLRVEMGEIELSSDECIHRLRKEVDWNISVHGKESPRTYYSKLDLGTELATDGQIREALELFKEVQTSSRRLLGPTDDLTVEAEQLHGVLLGKIKMRGGTENS